MCVLRLLCCVTAQKALWLGGALASRALRFSPRREAGCFTGLPSERWPGLGAVAAGFRAVPRTSAWVALGLSKIPEITSAGSWFVWFCSTGLGKRLDWHNSPAFSSVLHHVTCFGLADFSPRVLPPATKLQQGELQSPLRNSVPQTVQQ